jgi:pyridoxine 5'-phosphate synthase
MRLYINVDHVATLREARKTDEPDPVAAAEICEAAGADGITAHLREDRRHMQDKDLERLAHSVRTVLNFELASSSEIVGLACRLKPFQATLVPERREEITTEGGLDLSRKDPRLIEAINRLTGAGCRVSLFIDPTRESIDRARELGVPRSSCTPADTPTPGARAPPHWNSSRTRPATPRESVLQFMRVTASPTLTSHRSRRFSRSRSSTSATA